MNPHNTVLILSSLHTALCPCQISITLVYQIHPHINTLSLSLTCQQKTISIYKFKCALTCSFPWYMLRTSLVITVSGELKTSLIMALVLWHNGGIASNTSDLKNAPCNNILIETALSTILNKCYKAVVIEAQLLKNCTAKFHTCQFILFKSLIDIIVTIRWF